MLGKPFDAIPHIPCWHVNDAPMAFCKPDATLGANSVFGPCAQTTFADTGTGDRHRTIGVLGMDGLHMGDLGEVTFLPQTCGRPAESCRQRVTAVVADVEGYFHNAAAVIKS